MPELPGVQRVHFLNDKNQGQSLIFASNAVQIIQTITVLDY
jgi:hypothetical protein